MLDYDKNNIELPIYQNKKLQEYSLLSALLIIKLFIQRSILLSILIIIAFLVIKIKSYFTNPIKPKKDLYTEVGRVFRVDKKSLFTYAKKFNTCY